MASSAFFTSSSTGLRSRMVTSSTINQLSPLLSSSFYPQSYSTSFVFKPRSGCLNHLSQLSCCPTTSKRDIDGIALSCGFIPRADFTTVTLMLERKKRQEEEKRRKGEKGEERNRFSWLKYCFVIFPITTFALGTWQVYRKDWKEKILADAAAKLAEDPVALPSQIPEEARDGWQYRRVEVKGVFDHDKEILVGPRLFDSEDGYHVVTPIVRTDDGPAVLVNRGWIPKKFKSPASRERSQVKGEQTIIGFMKNTPPKGRWVPENEPENNNWFWLDVPTIQDKKIKDYPLFPLVLYSTTNSPSGLPRAHPPTVDIRNQHLSYIFTWYSLTIAFTIMTKVLLKK